MGGVLAWIVAVERHTPAGNGASPLDFPSPVSTRALEWAEWLAAQPGTRLLLNVAVAPGSPQRARLDALAPQALNAAEAHLATSAALHNSLSKVTTAPLADTLLLLWLGHGVMVDRRRFLLHEDSRDTANLRSWDVDSLLQRLRTGDGPALQIGVFDTCAQVLAVTPANENLGGDGAAQRRQHCFFAATAGAFASLNPHEVTLASIVLDELKALPWPPQPAPLHEKVQPRMNALPSLPVVWEWTAGSGDLWSRASADPGLDAEVTRSARDAGLEHAYFRHLWQELRGGNRAPADLAKALRGRRVDQLADELRAAEPDTAEALQAAWARVQRVAPWGPALAALHLGIGHWSELASVVAARDGRKAPRFAELGELLLWAIDMGYGAAGGARAEKALLALIVLAAKEAARSVPGSEAAVQALRALLQADATFAPLLGAAEAATPLPERPLVLLVELQLPPNERQPVLGNRWLLRDGRIEPGPQLELAGPAGHQLITLVEHVRQQTERPLRLELLAPAELLCGRREWVSYSFDDAPDAGAEIEIDVLVPVCWRWRDRMIGKDARYAAGAWRQRAREARQRSHERASLRCQFDDEQPALADPDLLGLAAQPPGPAEQGQRRARFLQALVRGHPYMVWPAADPGDVKQLKACVHGWLAQQKLLDLPEGYGAARSQGRLPHPLVLFFDEPDHNPYAQMGRLSTQAGN